MGKHEKISSSSAERTARYRARMRAKGFKLKQIWVYDTSRPGFWEEINRQCRAISESPREADDQAWADSFMDWDALPPMKEE